MILDIFEYQPEIIELETIPEYDFPGNIFNDHLFSLKLHALLSYKRNILLLKNWKDAHSQNQVLNTQIFQKIISTSN